MIRADTLTALALGAAVGLQGVLLARLPGLAPSAAASIAATGLLAGMVAALLWRLRELFAAHADMLLIMGAAGGLGMLLGSLYDGRGLPACHAVQASGWGMHLGMLAGGFVPALPASRCLRAARRDGLLVPVLLFDLLGMEAGMLTAHHLLGLLPPAMNPLLLVAHHVLMTAGMLSGMAVTMAARPAGLRLWSRVATIRYTTGGTPANR